LGALSRSLPIEESQKVHDAQKGNNVEVDAPDQLGLGRVRRALNQLGRIIILLPIILRRRFGVFYVWRSLRIVCILCVRLAWETGVSR
jgi:hypothetical protein